MLLVGPMISFFVDSLACLSALVRSRYNLGLEILALRQQLGILKRKHPHPRLLIYDDILASVCGLGEQRLGHR